ncbi:nitroreductase family protein [Xanthobacter sp. KR7-65]|uniref:nitroreductase family protein n=1 Tax=Xanthobacter sp. KR7-65 TaxID=3156612 RepID=UPI0032B4F281
MNALLPPARPYEVALAYHMRTKHSLKAYAAGPETLDWDMQPNPFREFEGAPRIALPLAAERLEVSFADMVAGRVSPAPLHLAGVALLLELSFGLAAWKQLGPDRWALRCNPSSGNLHPTEAYVLAQGVTGLADGVHHYVSRDHALEQRFSRRTGGSVAVASASGFVMEQYFSPPPGPARLHLALSSIHWREAWKYGERAFRYCQLDLGHALAAVRYAAACLGWTATLVDGVDSATLAALAGIDRAGDFGGAEREDPDLLIALAPAGAERPVAPDGAVEGRWAGKANVLDRHPLYRWPVIDQVSRATEAGSASGAFDEPAAGAALPARVPAAAGRAAGTILGRRSAQRFTAKGSTMPRETFFDLLDALLPRASAPFDAWGFAPRIHPLFFVHRVDGLVPGLYALPRRDGAEAALRAALRTDFQWTAAEGCPAHIPLRRLVETDCRGIARTVSCHQAIASDSSFAVAMLSEFEATVSADPWRYRQLHWEAGLLGHVLYLEAEAAGYRGTGIGCYFDDDLHQLLGLEGAAFQSLYHFTVGRAALDDRITTEPAYPGRAG